MLQNNSILNYENPKKKKVNDNDFSLTGGEADDAYTGDFGSFDERMNDLENSMERSQNFLNSLEDKQQREEFYRNQTRNFLVPKDTEMRRRQQYVMSKQGVEDALDGYYNETLRPRFEADKKEAYDEGRREFESYARVPGANPHAALGRMQSANDPLKVINKTMSSVDDDELNDIAGAYAGYAGLDADSYKENVLKPDLYNRMTEEYVKERTPDSSSEYIMRGAYDNSLLGKMMTLPQNAYYNNKNQRMIDDAAMSNYKAGRVEDFASGVGALLIDSAVFPIIGGMSGKVVKGATSLAQKRIASKVLAKEATHGMTAEGANAIAKRVLMNDLKTKITQSAIGQGLTLGTYDAANSVADDILHGGDVDFANAAKGFTKGFATGAALGVVGVPLRKQANRLTGFKKVAAGAGVLSAESAVFTAANEIEKVASGIDIEPIDLVHDFGESAATLLAMRMFHWRPSAKNKLNTVGRLKEELRFTPTEKHEIIAVGVDPDAFVSALERSIGVPSRGFSKDALEVKDNYLKLMSSSELSAATRSKLLYIVEDKLTSTPPIPVDYKIDLLDDGTTRIEICDITGGKIESKIFDTKTRLETFLLRNVGALRSNRIKSYEKMLSRNYNTQDFFRQAGMYAKEKNIDADIISEAMYKKAKNEPLSIEEEGIMNDILSRTGYADRELGNMLVNMRHMLEDKYRLFRGTLTNKIDDKPYRCSPRENEAINEYEKMMLEKVRMLDDISANRTNLPMLENNPYGQFNNEEILDIEREVYTQNMLNVLSGNVNKNTVMNSIGQLTNSNKLFEPPKNWDESYVWNLFNNKTTREKLNHYANYADKISKNLGLELKLIRDIREIKRDSGIDWIRKRKSLGWYDSLNDKVVINLPNISSMEQLKRTIMHEVVGHYSFAHIFGKDLNKFLIETYDRASPKVKLEMFKRANKYNTNKIYIGVEEYLAELCETSLPMPIEQRSIKKRFYDFIKNMLVRLKIFRPEEKPQLSEDYIRELINRHHWALMQKRSYKWERKNLFNDIDYSKYTDDDVKNYDFRIAFGRDFENDIMKKNEEVKYRFIGENGVKNLVKNGHGASYLNNLNQAIELRAKEKNPALIKAKTGWEEGADGKWRMEINDNLEVKDYIFESLKNDGNVLAKYYLNIINKDPKDRTSSDYDLLKYIISLDNPYDYHAKLVDIVKDNLFFGAYPEFKQMPVVFKELSSDEPCIYDPRNMVLFLDKRALPLPSLKKKLAVSMQRMIQDYEDFARGFKLNKIATPHERENYEKHKNYANRFMNNLKRLKSLDYETLLKNYRTDEYGASYYTFEKDFPSLNEYVTFARTGEKKSLGGNVELRNVERRFNFPESKRRFTTAESTEDIPRSRQLQINRFHLLDGPLDLIYRGLRNVDSDAPFSRWRRFLDDKSLSPMQRETLKRRIKEKLREYRNEQNRIIDEMLMRYRWNDIFDKDNNKGDS